MVAMETTIDHDSITIRVKIPANRKDWIRIAAANAGASIQELYAELTTQPYLRKAAAELRRKRKGAA